MTTGEGEAESPELLMAGMHGLLIASRLSEKGAPIFEMGV
jgi:hypothetical protein